MLFEKLQYCRIVFAPIVIYPVGMKKLIIILSLILCAGTVPNTLCSAGVIPTTKTIIDKVETSLFGYTYPSETETKRLDRIELQVYGKTNTGTPKERLTKLGKDLAAQNIGSEIAPKEDTFAQESDKYKDEESYNLAKQNGAATGAASPVAQPAAGPGVDYPAINELEKLVFNQEFKSSDLNTRLDKLEQKAFQKSYAGEDFSTRVDRLRGQLKPQSLQNNAIAQSSNDYYFDDNPITLDRDYNLPMYNSPNTFNYDKYNATNDQFNYGRPQKKINLTAIESAMFKRSYQSDDIDKRLSRLENSMFGTVFDSDNEQARMNRISSAYKATKSVGKYDSNKFQQHMATGMQIGMFILMVLACIL